ncbi:MAG: PAS domain S-box protein [Bacteroidota bacterium]|nr:PAS domain S-box protein [Bacteroidota bacterium]
MSLKTKILYLEYAHGDATLAGQVLKNAGVECEVLSVQPQEDYLPVLTSFHPDLVISGDVAPSSKTIAALANIKKMGLAIPLIAVNAPSQDSLTVDVVNVMKHGAYDYILKDAIGSLTDAILNTLENHNTQKDTNNNLNSFLNYKKARLPEDELIQSERRYRQIVESAHEGVWIIDENLLTVFVNKKMCDMLGYSSEEMIGKHNYDFKDVNEKKKTIERIQQRSHSTVEVHESTFITKSGDLVVCNVATNGLFDDEGRYLGTLAMLTDITQRKADEDALKRSEANLSAIIENTTDLVYSLDSDFKLITFNQPFKNAMKHVYGFHIEQGANMLALVNSLDPDMAIKWRGIYKRALSGETMQFVNEYPFGNDKVYLNYSINPIWQVGKVIGMSCFSRDISRQKLDEIAIKKSAANLTAIIENTDASIYSLDTDLRCITFNKLFKDNVLKVYNIEVKPGDSILNFLGENDPDQGKEWEKTYARALTGKGVQFTKEYSINNVTSFINFSINPIWENDVVIGLSCAARDITKQISDEMAIRKSEASLRTIFNNTDMACILLDNNASVVSFNTLAKKFFEEQNNITISAGYAIINAVDEERRCFVLDILNQTKNGSAINYQLRRETNGITKWFDLTWAGIKDIENQDFGHVFTVKDITEKKKSEIEWEKITTDLIRRNKALEQFTYILSHNLRAPLANIIGLSSLLKDPDIEVTEFNKIVNSISHSAYKLDGIILDLNQVLQVNEDINEIIELISLSKLIEDIKFSIRNLIEKEHVRIIYDFTEASEMLSIKSFIYSVFYNLITNSIKYRNPGMEPFITIRTSVCNGKVSLFYDDNGRGIDMSRYADEIFGLYKRFDTSVEGKGMGLFMVKMQVESLGGSITVHSILDKGTGFVVEFPQMQLANPS